MSEQGLVAILRAGAGDEHDCRKRSFALGNSESRGERYVLYFVFVGNVFVEIGIGFHRILRAFGLERGFIFYRLQYERRVLPVPEGATCGVDRGMIGGDDAFEDAV